MLEEHIVSKYNIPVPRYTSYPPANYFGELSEEAYREAVSKSNQTKDSNLSFYMHSGSMFTLFFNDSPVRDFQDTKKSDQERFARYFRNMLNRGIYVSPSQFEGNFISEVHTPEVLDYVLESIAESI